MSMELMIKAFKLKLGSPVKKLVLVKLADNASDNGECWPSYQHIADQCELSRSAVRKHIKELEQLGYLKIINRKTPNKEKQNTSNLYILTLSGVPQENTGVPQENTGGVPQGGTRTNHSFESSMNHSLSIKIDEVAAIYSQTFTKERGFRQPKALTDKRKKAFNARLKDYPKAQDIEWWKSFFTQAIQSKFLNGQIKNDRNWKPDFDFFISPNGFMGVVEGKYE